MVLMMLCQQGYMMKLQRILCGLVCLAVASVSMASQSKPMHPIGEAKAKAVALKKYHGKVVGKVALENEEGKWEYAVNVRTGKTLREVMVDASTGKIANVEVTTPAEEAKEAKAEAMAEKKMKGKQKPKMNKKSGGESDEKGE